MSTELNRDPDREWELGTLLREAAGPAPEPDWDALHRRITAAAELPLARSRRSGRVPRPLLRTLVPLAAAAGLAGAFLALNPGEGELPPQEQAMIEQMVDASLPESVDQLITGEAAQGALLEVVAGS